jgi:SAM-dependent methyltransferase
MKIACRMCNVGPCRQAGSVDGYRFVECVACGFVFCPDIDGRRMQAPDPGAPDPSLASSVADAGFLTPVLALAGERALHVLDFGCGSPMVPDLLRARGHRVTVVDLSPPACSHPDRLTGDLAGAHFDLVYAFQVFEHLPHPRGILDELLRVTAPGGLIAIHTDMETGERGAFVDWWYVRPPEHCSFYQHRTFARFVEGTDHSLVLGLPRMIVMRKGHAPGIRRPDAPARSHGPPAPGAGRPEMVHPARAAGCDGSTK